jgi:hypothetical protein
MAILPTSATRAFHLEAVANQEVQVEVHLVAPQEMHLVMQAMSRGVHQEGLQVVRRVAHQGLRHQVTPPEVTLRLSHLAACPGAAHLEAAPLMVLPAAVVCSLEVAAHRYQ